MINIEKMLGGLETGQAQVFMNISMFPLLRAECQKSDYIMLDEALKTGNVEITEILEGGSVPETSVLEQGG